jgi:two-component system chemotaxis response regulator CheY
MTLTILYVEDHRIVADTVKETLEAQGWRVITCADGAVALDKLAITTSYDLLITDNHLPNVNGVEIVRYARQLIHHKNTPIVMLSASENRKDAHSAGVNVFLRKPDDMSRLVETVERLLNGRH